MAFTLCAPDLAPNANSFFGNLSMGNAIAGCLLAAFIVLAVVCGFFWVCNLRGRLNQLDEPTRLREAQEEELANIGCKHAPVRQKRDPWA
jgi:hypothetical protein